MDYVYISSHVHVADTGDGGLEIWLRELGFGDGHGDVIDLPAAQTKSRPAEAENVLHAHCACNTVRFHISRPDASSSLPHSQFPDLMIPYHTRDPLIPNVGGEKWWLRADGTKYLAGTCACRSCRLTSGFEVQTWAFVPRSNIFFHVSGSAGSRIDYDNDDEPGEVIPLDFNVLRRLEREGKGVLKSYESSPGVLREFCPICGATIFWHDRWRPELIDVSVGLLEAEEGARAEEWLGWWCERASFEEEAERKGEDDTSGGDSTRDRRGVERHGKRWDLIPAFKRGLGTWDKDKWKEKNGGGTL